MAVVLDGMDLTGAQRSLHGRHLCQREKKRLVGKTKRGKGTKIMAIHLACMISVLRALMR